MKLAIRERLDSWERRIRHVVRRSSPGTPLSGVGGRSSSTDLGRGALLPFKESSSGGDPVVGELEIQLGRVYQGTVVGFDLNFEAPGTTLIRILLDRPAVPTVGHRAEVIL